MKSPNGIQMSVNVKWWKVCHNLLDDWNANHKEQTRETGKKLTIQRLTLTLAKLLEQRPDIVSIILNAEIDLDEI